MPAALNGVSYYNPPQKPICFARAPVADGSPVFIQMDGIAQPFQRALAGCHGLVCVCV